MSSSEEPAPRERLEGNLKSPYPADGLVWSALIEAVAEEIAELESARQDVLAAKFVASASGKQLERLASIFELERRTGEPVSKYRLRVQTALRSQLSSGTLSDIREAIAALLEGELEDVIVQEPTETADPRVNIGVWNEQLEDRDLTAEEFFEEAEPLTAAGVGVEGFSRGTFQFTADEEPVESEHGFAKLNEDGTGPVEGTGGTWPGLLRPE